MRILIEGENLEHYLAKCHEAFRTGLRAMFDARCFGKGYSGYWPFARSYSQIVRRAFPDAPPDILLATCEFPVDLRGFKYAGLAELDVVKVILLADYWVIAEHYYDEYMKLVHDNGIDLVLSYFPQPIRIWSKTAIADRLIYLPPCFDPNLFNDWQMPKFYDVGFLAADTLKHSDFYPERFTIHQKLLRKNGIRYLYAPHPGWKRHRSHPLVGRNFSMAINSCKIFVTTGGRYHNAQPKIFEALASKVLLMSDEAIGADMLGLEDGVNYVKISQDDVLDKIDYYLSHPDLCEGIAEAGYRLALSRHSCYARSVQFYEQISTRLGDRLSTKAF